MDPRPKQTFGIELEFLLVAKVDHEFMRTFPLGPDQLPLIRHEYPRQAVHAVVSQDRRIPFWEYSVGKSTDSNRKGRYDKWAVTQDGSVGFDARERQMLPGWQYYSIEMVSRIFDYYEDNWSAEISRVLQLLVRGFNGPGLANTCRVIVNSTCGLHVHVAKGTSSSNLIHLQTLKNLYYVASGFERIIDEAHCVDRIGARERPRYCMGPSFLWRDEQVRNPLQFVERFDEQVQERPDLALLGIYQHHNAYNFSNCFRQRLPPHIEATMRERGMIRKEKSGTVEFRQHRGTLDSDEILAWVKAVTAMMSWADASSRSQALRFVAQNYARPDYHFHDLLRDIGAGNGLVQYYRVTLAPRVEWQRMMREIDSVPPGSEVEQLVNYVEHQRCRTKDFYQVRQAIGRKLRTRQLGYFPQRMLEALPQHYWT